MVKLEKSRDQGAGSFWGAEGTPGLVSARLSNVSPGLPEFPRWRARGLSERTAKPEAGAEARWVAWCQGRRSVGCLQRAGGWPGSPRSWALPARPPLSPQAGGVRRAQSAPSAPARLLPQLRESGAREELSPPSKAERRSCPKSRRCSAPPLGSCRSGARCRVSSEAAAGAVRTWALAPGPRQARGGAGRRPGRGRGT